MSKIAKEVAGKISGAFSRNYNSYATKRRYLLTIPLVARFMVPFNTRLNPLDDFVWGVLVREVNCRSYNTKKAPIIGQHRYGHSCLCLLQLVVPPRESCGQWWCPNRYMPIPYIWLCINFNCNILICLIEKAAFIIRYFFRLLSAARSTSRIILFTIKHVSRKSCNTS